VDTKAFELRWDKAKDNVSVTFIRDGNQATYSAEAKLIATIPPLPQAIASDESIASIADHYRNVLRGFRKSGMNAMDAFSEVLGARLYGVVNLRLTANAPAVGLLGLSWELLLHDSDPDLLREKLGSVAVARSLQKTLDYSPEKIDAAFRVVLLQGAPGDPPLDFAGERKALEGAWAALGVLLSDRIARPKILPANLHDLATHLITEKPHLLWFSGHGRQKNDDFELLFPNGSSGEWHSVSALSQAIEKAQHQSHHVPLVVAFWACDGTRTPAGPPSLDAANTQFPVLVDKMLRTGVESVLGVQTQVYDSTARTMGESFFRAIAEGRGPAAALASARVDLHRNPSRFAPGSRSEWTSPVLWTNGADLPRIRWVAPLEENEAIVFHRLGRESLLQFEGGRDILAEPAELSSPSAARAWCQDAPIWITSRDLPVAARQLSVIRDLRQLVLTERKTVLLIRYSNISDQSVLDAVTRSFRELKRRIFPTPSDEAIDVLVSLFQAFSSGNRKDAWLRLLRQPELVIAIFAEGGMAVDDDLAAATSSPAKIIVLSNHEAANSDGKPLSLPGWKADDIPTEAPPPDPDEPTSAFLSALALLDRPLAQNAITLFARDFGLDAVDSVVRDFMVRFGARYVVKASIARRLIEKLNDDERRAAHRACMNFLQRVPNILDADHPTQLAWRLTHALKAREFEVGLLLAENAIDLGSIVGNYGHIAEVYKELGAVRKALRIGTKLEVAFAQIQMGQAQPAYDLIRQIPLESLEDRADRLRLAVRQAEALRNLKDRAKHAQSIEVLEKASQSVPTKNWSVQEKRWWLAARQDLARNLHYFGGDVLKVRAIFEDVVKRCGDNPAFAYIKAAALRNLSDIYNKYGFGKIKADKELAATYLGEAIAIAESTANVRSLLPEFLYLSAKLDYSKGRVGDAGGTIRRAIDLARSGGLARILGLSINKFFWWEVGPLTPDSCQKSFEFSKWQRIDEQLGLLSQDPWVARALVSSRLHAAKSLDLLSKKITAIEVLQHARAQLEESTLFEGEADFRGRWQPVFAGLARLNASSQASSGAQPYKYDEKVWNGLRAIGERIFGTKDFQLPEPQQVWEGVA